METIKSESDQFHERPEGYWEEIKKKTISGLTYCLCPRVEGRCLNHPESYSLEEEQPEIYRKMILWYDKQKELIAHKD